MKPNWQDAPEWANYLAMNNDGAWYWFEFEPKAGGYIWSRFDGRRQRARFDWRDSLEERPKDEK